MYQYLLPVAAAVAAPAADAQPAAQTAIEAVMSDSAAGWNSGDLARFVAISAPDASYVAGGAVVRGKDAIAARYAKSFADGGNVRGSLGFAFLSWRPVGKAHMMVVARWTLTPAGGAKAETGLTSLLFERRAEGWRIVSDHSS